jgi:arylsulfatase A-like enzyme
VLLANCPRLISGGRTLPLADFTDIYPTVCELAGVPHSARHRPEGVSFAPFLLARPGAVPPRAWILNEYHETRVVRDSHFKLYNDGRLFDVAGDPDEQHDLSRSPAPGPVAARERLQRVLDSLPGDSPPPFLLRSQSGFKIRGEGRAQR